MRATEGSDESRHHFEVFGRIGPNPSRHRVGGKAEHNGTDRAGFVVCVRGLDFTVLYRCTHFMIDLLPSCPCGGFIICTAACTALSRRDCARVSATPPRNLIVIGQRMRLFDALEDRSSAHRPSTPQAPARRRSFIPDLATGQVAQIDGTPAKKPTCDPRLSGGVDEFVASWNHQPRQIVPLYLIMRISFTGVH